MKSKQLSKKVGDDTLSLIKYVIMTVIVVLLVYIINFYNKQVSFNTQDWGAFGSYLGGTIGVIFTAGSLIYLAKTLNFERNKAERDNFDNKFFLMLEITENIKNKISENKKDDLLLKINNIEEFTLENTLIASKKIMHNFNSDFGHYYRMIYQILKMINKYEKDFLINRDEILYYTNILRSTLDFKLTQILAVNTYYSTNFDEAYRDYSQYCRKYDFFQHMPFSILDHKISESLIAIYLNDQTGFKNSNFVENLNQNFINLGKELDKLKSNYDLLDFFFNLIIGSWSSEDKKIKFYVFKNQLNLAIDNYKITFHLDNYHPDNSGKRVKLNYLINANSIELYFDEKLNLNINISEDIDIYGESAKYTLIVLNYIDKENLEITTKGYFHNFSDINFIYEKILLKKIKCIPYTTLT